MQEEAAADEAAAEKKANEQALVLEKAAAEKKAKEEAFALEKAAAEKKAQEEVAAAEKAEAEKQIKEAAAAEKAAAEKKANEEALALEKAMSSLLQEGAHSEVRDIIENSLSKLKNWIDIRLQQQEDLLRCFCNGCQHPGSTGNVRGMAVKVNTCAPSEVDLSVSRIEPVTGYTDVGEVFHQLQNSDEVGTQVRVIKPAMVDTSDAHSEGLVEDVPLPGSLPEAAENAGDEANSIRDSKKGETKLQGDARESKSRERAERDLWPDHWHLKLMDIFDQLDLDRSGSIEITELMDSFEYLGLPEVRDLEVFKSIHKTDKGSIDRLEWLRFIDEAGEGSRDDLKLLNWYLERLAVSQQQTCQTRRVRDPVCLLRHDSIKRISWDCWIIILLFYIAWSVPYSLGLSKNDALDVMDRITDISFGLDVVLNFRTSYLDQGETVIVDCKKIACKYLKSRFVLDVLSALPFDVIASKVFPYMMFVRLTKIRRIANVIKFFSATESESMFRFQEILAGRASQTFKRMVSIAGMTFLLAHWLACFGNAVAERSLDYHFEEGNVPSLFQRYLAAMYWAMTTLSSGGYGDIMPKSDEEVAYAMIAMIVGICVYGYIIGSITSMVTETDLNAKAFKERMELVTSWLESHGEFPQLLRFRLKKHFIQALDAKGAIDDASILSELSPELRADTAFFLLDVHVRCHPMFSNIPNSASAKLVEVLRKSTVPAKQFVVRQGDPGIAMYCLVSGTARYDQGTKWQPEGAELKGVRFEMVSQGDSFGEEIIFGLEEAYLYAIITMSDCEFHSITKDAFMEHYQNMPDLRGQMLSAFLQSRGLVQQ